MICPYFFEFHAAWICSKMRTLFFHSTCDKIKPRGDDMDSKLTGKIIADKRKSLGLNQIQLGEALNVSNRTVSKWENGDGYPDITLLPDISRVLDISIDELLTGKKRAEAHNDKKLINDFKIMLALSLFLALFSAVLGSITELYNFRAFTYILFYNHWEIMFTAVSLGTTLLSIAIFVIGAIRLRLNYSSGEMFKITKKPANALAALLCVFPLFFVLRVLGLGMLKYTAAMVTGAVAVITAVIIFVINKKLGDKYEN